MGQDVDDGHVVLVETEAVSAELGEEGLHGATHNSELLPSDVVGDLVVAPKAPGLVGLVQDSTPAEAAGVVVEVGCLHGAPDRGTVVLGGDTGPPL